MSARWMGTRVEILRKDGMWVTVRFLESCKYFKKGTLICITNCYITVERMPLIREIRTPIRSFGHKFSSSSRL